ncbi:SDR family oxidoreductase [Daejeonella oryzae]|uniref:SDR family oxidoreductase n=1 Tax=Daejeonella oryzae TaxID=1122943 RepID=UPI00040ED219|nr:SDR family oxidoreductase [Daejeonella oryzae]
MKRILVTGSNGLLGQKLTDAILKNPEMELIATSIGADRYPGEGDYTYSELDVCNAENVKQVLHQFRPDVIIHTAAMTNVDICEIEKEKCWTLNVEAVKNLIHECELLDIHLIHISTDFIFDGENGPYTEDAEPHPLSYYGLTKLEGEKILQTAKCPWTILRTIIVYGIVNDMSRSNIVLWAKGALEKGDPINVVNDQWRMPTLAEDLADCCLLAAKSGATGIYNASGKDMMSIIELVEQVAEYWNLNKNLINEISSDSLNQAAKRPARTGFVLNKTIDELGYRPHSFKEGLAIVDKQLQSRINKK